MYPLGPFSANSIYSKYFSHLGNIVEHKHQTKLW